MADYEFIPKQELRKLEEEVIALKSHPILQDEHAVQLKEHMSALHQSMERMLDVFKKASSDMELEEREDQLMTKHLKPVIASIEHFSEQNETIAQGIVSVQDRLDDFQLRLDKQERMLTDIISMLQEHQSNSSQQHTTSSFSDHNPFTVPETTQSFSPPPQQFNPNPFPQMPPMQQGPSSMGPPAGNAIPPLEENALGHKKKKKGFFG